MAIILLQVETIIEFIFEAQKVGKLLPVLLIIRLLLKHLLDHHIKEIY
jgi:hypothetical protein